MKTLRERCEELKHLRHEIKVLHDIKSAYGGNSDTYDKELERYLTSLMKEYELLTSAIAKVPHSLHRTILLERFIKGKTWEQIAISTQYNFYHVIKRLIPKAMADLQRVLDGGK